MAPWTLAQSDGSGTDGGGEMSSLNRCWAVQVRPEKGAGCDGGSTDWLRRNKRHGSEQPQPRSMPNEPTVRNCSRALVVSPH